MALENIFADVAELMGDDVSFGGPDQVDHEDKPPRITWEPTSARYEPARRTGGGGGDQGPILTRRWTLQVQIWGASLLETEQLVDRFLATMNGLVSLHSFSPTEDVWNVGGVGDKGVLCTLGMTIDAPVLRTPAPSLPVTALNPTFKLDDTQV